MNLPAHVSRRQNTPYVPERGGGTQSTWRRPHWCLNFSTGETPCKENYGTENVKWRGALHTDRVHLRSMVWCPRFAVQRKILSGRTYCEKRVCSSFRVECRPQFSQRPFPWFLGEEMCRQYVLFITFGLTIDKAAETGSGKTAVCLWIVRTWIIYRL